ncbi:hypothetical protein AGMMS49975_00210 [Clostridia bacterium]|nr:hypothetical protein AGMMS49975_00210 [Clostridia bacterium]
MDNTNDNINIFVSRLLRKRKWTGSELGKAYIYSLIDDYRKTLSGELSPEPIINPARFQKMLDTLDNIDEICIKNRYIGINNWLMQYSGLANAHLYRLKGNIDFFTSLLDASYEIGKQIKENQGDIKVLEILNNLNTSIGLEKFSKNYESLSERFEAIQEDIYFIKGYNTAISLIAEKIDCKEFEIFFVEPEYVTELIDEYNDRSYKIASDLFNAIEFEKIEIPPENIKEAKTLLDNNLQAFEQQDGVFADLLTIRP